MTDNDFVGLGLDFCDESACAGGTAVENPNDNRGLVGDCQALMAAKDGPQGHGGAGLVDGNRDPELGRGHGQRLTKADYCIESQQ